MVDKEYWKQKASRIMCIMAGMLIMGIFGVNEISAQSINSAQLVDSQEELVEESQAGDDIIQSGICEDGLEWVFTSDGTLTIRGDGPMQDYMFRGGWIGVVTAPWGDFTYADNKITRVVVEDGVTRIGANAFSIGSVESASIAGSVTEIGDFAFGAYMSVEMSLKSVELHEGLKIIGDRAFYNTPLAEIKIPSTVSSIEDGAFAGCEFLTNVELNEGLERIGGGVFANCPSLKKVKIPASVISLEEKMVKTWSDGQGEINYYLYSSNTLENIEVDENNPVYSSADGVVYSKDGTTLICYPSGKKDASFSIPSNVKNINDGAFAECENLINIKISNGVKRVGALAFYGCYKNLKVIEFPESVSSIGRSALSGCASLGKIIIRNSRCDIYDSKETLCNPLYEDIVIYGYSGSTVEMHAKKYGYKFAALNTNVPEVKPADQTIKCATSNLKLTVGAERALKVTGAKTKITFLSSNPKIVAVGKNNGRIKALQPGIVTITAKAAPTEKYKAAFVTLEIRVSPKTCVIKSLKSAKKGQVTIKSTVDTKGCTGYQIQYKIGSGKIHTITQKSNKALAYTLRNCKSGKKFKVRIRAYKKVNGVAYYGKYSKWKTLKKIK